MWGLLLRWPFRALVRHLTFVVKRTLVVVVVCVSVQVVGVVDHVEVAFLVVVRVFAALFFDFGFYRWLANLFSVVAASQKAQKLFSMRPRDFSLTMPSWRVIRMLSQ